MDKFYEGQNILITGATGFLGKVFLEKILRSLSCNRLFLLVRKKKDMTAHERVVKEIRNSPIFDYLRSQRADFNEWFDEKVVSMTGDITEELLGLSEPDLAILREELTVIIHCAATITFNDPLIEALDQNALGSMRALNVAKQCKNLRAFTHVSTAYVGCKFPCNSVVYEKVHPLGSDPDQLVDDLKRLTPAEIEQNIDKILSGYPNTYTYTKNIGEELLLKHRGNIPLAIIRPSIVGSAWKEPTPGWIDAISAAAVIYVACGAGLLSVMNGNINLIGDQVPVDHVVNGTLAATAAMDRRDGFEIYHIGTSSRNPLRWTKVYEGVIPYWDAYPPTRRMGPADFLFIPNPYIFSIVYYLRFTLPVQMYNALSNSPVGTTKMKKNAALLKKLAMKREKIASTFRYFTTNQWFYDTTNLENLFKALSPEEQQRFNFDVTDIDWILYLQQFCWGIKHYCLKEPLKHPLNDREMQLSHIKKGLFPDIRFVLKVGPEEQPRISEGLRRDIIKSARVQAEVLSIAQSQSISVSEVEKSAHRILDTMSGNVSMNVIRLMGWLFRKIYRHLYQGVVVDSRGMKTLRDIPSHLPIVLMPNHRSYIDFLIVSYVCFTYRLPLPHIAAGDDFLSIMIVNWLFRHSGAFFMRRTFGGDGLYRSVLTEYITRLVTGGHRLEFFIEGTRSRTGKNLNPKMGLLSIVLDSYFDGQVPDVCLVPMSLNYDKVVEEEQHIRELLGEPKPKMSLSGLMTNGVQRLRRRNFGRINIQLGQPIKLSDFKQELNSPYAENDKEYRKHFTRKMAYRIVHEFNKESVCMSTALVASILLTERRVMSLEVLSAKVDWLRAEIESRGGRVDRIDGADANQIVKHTISLMEEVVDVRRNIIEPRIVEHKDYRNLIQLGCYANQLMYVFFHEGVVSLAYNALSTKDVNVPAVTLLQTAEFIYSLLRLEVHDSSDPDESADFGVVLQNMKQRGILEERDGFLRRADEGDRVYNLMLTLYRPYIEAYWVVLLTFMYARAPLSEKNYQERSMWLAEKLYNDGTLRFFESCTRSTLSNAYQLFQNWNLLSKNEKGVLSVTNEDQLQDVYERVVLARGEQLVLDKSLLKDLALIHKL